MHSIHFQSERINLTTPHPPKKAAIPFSKGPSSTNNQPVAKLTANNLQGYHAVHFGFQEAPKLKPGERESQMWRFNNQGERVPDVTDWDNMTQEDVVEYLLRNDSSLDADGPPSTELIKALKADGLLGYFKTAFGKDIENGKKILFSDVGAGANFVNAFLLSGVAKSVNANNYEIDLIEPTRAFREVLKRSLYGKNIADIPLQEMLWNKFRDEMKEHGGSAWDNRFDDLRKHCRIVNESIFNLPKNKYHVASTFYTPCSMNNTVEEFNQSIKSFVESAKPGGLVMAALVEGTKGWPAGESWLPGVSITKEIVENAFQKAGAYVNVKLLDVDPRIQGDTPPDQGDNQERILLVTGIRKLD